MIIEDKIVEFIDDLDDSEWIVEAKPDHLTVKIGDWRGEQNLTITPDAVAVYFRDQAPNISSGCRTLAGYSSDWRPIDNLAKFAMYYFKYIDSDAFRKVCIANGLTPKF